MARWLVCCCAAPIPVPCGAIGVISLRGSIMTGASRSFPVPLPLLGEETLGSTTAQQVIRRAAKDDRLAAVVVHVDSPGGSALASDLIWRELAQLDRIKPVVVYMGDVAASRRLLHRRARAQDRGAAGHAYRLDRRDHGQGR